MRQSQTCIFQVQTCGRVRLSQTSVMFWWKYFSKARPLLLWPGSVLTPRHHDGMLSRQNNWPKFSPSANLAQVEMSRETLTCLNQTGGGFLLTFVQQGMVLQGHFLRHQQTKALMESEIPEWDILLRRRCRWDGRGRLCGKLLLVFALGTGVAG